jgi:hypothetical protein
MKPTAITDPCNTLSRTRAASCVLFIAAVVITVGLTAFQSFAKTYSVGPGSANIGDTKDHNLCINGLDPATCTDGVVVTRDDAITGDRVEQWKVEITNTSTDTWKDFHVTLVWKANPLGGAYLSAGSGCDPLLTPTFLPAKDPHPQSMTCLRSNKTGLRDTWVGPGKKLTLTVTVVPYATTNANPRVATNYHLKISASTDGKLPSDLVISNTLSGIADPVQVGQPFQVSGLVTNADIVSHMVYFKTYGVNAAVSGTPTPFVMAPGDSVPFVLQVTALQDGWVSVSLLTWSEESAEGLVTPGTVYVQAQ